MTNDGGDDGKHRSADTPASGGAAGEPGGGAGQAKTYYESLYDALIRAGYPHEKANAIASNETMCAQQGTSLMGALPASASIHAQGSLAQAQLVQQQLVQAQLVQAAQQQLAMRSMTNMQALANQQGLNASWANQYVVPSHSGFTSTSMVRMPILQGWVEPLKPIEDAGISAGEIIGHRVWRYTHKEQVGSGLLQSMAMETLWPSNGPMHTSRVTDNGGGGIHAFKTAEDVVNEYQPSGGFWGEIKLVYGTVALWGTVIEHERGYRGEFARIHSLDSIPQLYRWRELRLLREIRERYGLTK